MVSVIAKKLRDIRINQALMDLCDEADTTNDGKISVEEYLLITRNYGIKLSDEDIRLVEHLANANRELSKNDFIFHIKNSNLFKQFDSVDPECDHHWDEKIRKAWKIFDKNGDGRISKQEFRWMTNQGRLTKKQINAVFQRFDTDGDGTLSFKEFKNMMLRNRTRKKAAKLQAEEEEAKKPKTVPHWKKHLYDDAKEDDDSKKQKVSFSLSEVQSADDIKMGSNLAEANLEKLDDKTGNPTVPNTLIQEVTEGNHKKIVELNDIKLLMVFSG